MIIAQLGVTAVVALTRLRAHAYAHDRRLRDVAADVVARRLRFHRDARTTARRATAVEVQFLPDRWIWSRRRYQRRGRQD